jgi:hypothetical protein
MNFIHWFATPKSSPNINKKNFVNVQIDAIGVGLASAAAPFLPVFLARLGASNLQVSMLTTMPAVTGLLLSIPLGRLLQRQKNIIPWFSGARLTVLSSYALTGLAVYFVPSNFLIYAILLIWALATIPQTLVAISFTVVMNAVAGPTGRFELMSRRWSILGITTAITVFIIGQVLGKYSFPLNFQVVFIGLSVGGLISYYFSSHLEVGNILLPQQEKQSFLVSTKQYLNLIRSEKPFGKFVSKRFIFSIGTALAAPIFPLYWVRGIDATDSQIAMINTVNTAILIVGYFFWTRQVRISGSTKILIWTSLGLSLYPIFCALTSNINVIIVFAGIAGIFQAGLNLVFFDELMKTVPPEYSASFVSFSQSLDYFPAIFAPLAASYLATQFGLSATLIISGAIRLIGVFLFFMDNRRSSQSAKSQYSQGTVE